MTYSIAGGFAPLYKTVVVGATSRTLTVLLSRDTSFEREKKNNALKMFSRYPNPKGRPKVCMMYESQHRIAAKSFDLYYILFKWKSRIRVLKLKVKVGGGGC